MAEKKPILLRDLDMDAPNMEIWKANQTTDPAAVKAITGRQYQGTSPSPQYLLAKATAQFGPVGLGFGWRVLAEHWRSYGDTTLHTCRIEFWWRDGEGAANRWEEYGETKIAYVAASGKQMVDDDGPKKSLTDAIVKALSRLGFSADIFLGRWDDAKYVAQLEAGNSPDAPHQPGPPPPQRRAPVSEVIEKETAAPPAATKKNGAPPAPF